MIPPNILIISCLTILVYGEQYTNLDYNEPTSSSIENEMKVTEQSFSLLNLKETTKPFPVNNDLKDAPPESANQDYINESSEVQENLFITVDDMESTGTEYRIPVTNLYSMSSSALDYTISEEARLGAENFNEKSTTSTTPKTTTSQIKEAPLVTLTPTTRVSTKSSSASPRIKMGKTIKTYKSSADQVLRQFVENSYLRHPVACIIDTTESNLRKAQMLWNATLRSNAPLDILLSGYNSTGIGGIYSFKNTKTLLTGLSSMKESSQTTESGKAFNAILKASELIPYDSAIFLSTDTDPTDFEKFGRAATVLIKKRIRLYLIWFGETSFEENETSERQGRTGGKLGELSLSTGGEILHIPNDALDKNGDLGLITLFARTGIQEMLDYEIPVVEPPTIQPLFTTKSPVPVQSTPIFEPISEFFVNGHFSPIISQHQNHRIYNSNRKWERLTVDDPDNDTNKTYDVGSASEQIDLALNFNKTMQFGKQISQQSAELITIIQPNLNSQLLVNPGSTVRVVFDVTNLRDQTVFHNFQVTGERAWLLNFGPRGGWIGPKQTIQVTVLAQVPQNAEVGLTDKITLISNSLTVTSQAVYVRVITGGALQDPHRPYLHYTYGARCDGKTEAGTCSNGFWSLEITTQDSQTGILRIESEPVGLVVRTPYVAGTKEDVRATFTASCCQPRVTVTSYDVAKNPSTFTVDVRDIWLSSAGIAAVTLGVLLGVLLIVLIIVLIVWCCCRNRESRDLPVYRSDSRVPSRSSRRT